VTRPIAMLRQGVPV